MAAGFDLPGVLEAITRGSLGFEEAKRLAAAMLEGELDDVGVAAVLAALKARGERPEEVAGFAAALREACVKVDTGGLDPLDTAGTGGDGAHTLNASTAAAVVAASLGVPVLKHGNRGVSSRSGSADFMEALGYRVDHGPEEARCMLARAGFAFLYAPRYHPALARVMPVRRKLGVRTIFNLVGPLANPGMVRRQLLGAATPGLARLMAEAGSVLGYERLVIVHGEPGIDEVSLSGETLVIEVHRGRVEEYRVTPRDLGLRERGLGELRVTSPAESVERFLAVARGRGRPGDREFIAANAGAALYAAGAVGSIRDGVEAALQAIDEGRVSGFIEEMLGVCRECCGGRG
ncbi:anthranilate phosphoribosyltransferase [Stetteria hydrogenophila]